MKFRCIAKFDHETRVIEGEWPDLQEPERLQQDVNQQFHDADLTASWTAAPAAQITGYHISLERPQCSILSE